MIQFNTEKKLWEYGVEPPENCNEFYKEAFLRYLNILFKIFQNAFEMSEFWSLWTLLGIRGMEDAGWNPFKSTISTITSIVEINDSISNYATQKNLHLWSYGHILEASEPYEIIANMIAICQGESFTTCMFPDINKRPQSPGQKIRKINEEAKKVGFEDISMIFSEIWDRELRNAIFHSDYCLYGDEIRIRKPYKVYTKREVNKYVNYSLAYLQAIESLRKLFIESYEEPKTIDVPTSFGHFQNEKARVIVRTGYGAVGIKDNWSMEDLIMGKIPYRAGLFFEDEEKMLDENPILDMLPERK